MKKLLNSIWGGISKVWNQLTAGAQRFAPIAIKVLENIKKFEDSGMGDVITRLIPGEADDKVNAKIKLWLPKVLLELQLVNDISNTLDVNEQLRMILYRLKISSDEIKNIYYHGLAALILEKCSDGKFTWSDSVQVAEYYYKKVYQPLKAARVG